VYCIGSLLTNEQISKWIIVRVLILVMRLETSMARDVLKSSHVNTIMVKLKIQITVVCPSKVIVS
jgi:hypothetical protein